MRTLENDTERIESDERHFGRKLNPANCFKDRLIIKHLRIKTNRELFEVDEHDSKSLFYVAKNKQE